MQSLLGFQYKKFHAEKNEKNIFDDKIITSQYRLPS